MSATIIKIYSKDWAEMTTEEAGKPYRPCNGTEGGMFIESWCGNCERDTGQDCQIVGNTFVYPVDHPDYPKEWQYGPDGQPRCTAFLAEGQPIPAPPDTATMDMFDGAAQGGKG